MFYEILNELCKSYGITVTFLLKRLKLSTSKGTAWKNGTMPNGDTLSLIADYFDVSVDYLIGRTDAATVPKSDISPKERYIINLFRQLTPDEQANITGRLELLVEQHEEAYRKDG